ncbi:MAG: hypothetical protein RL017_795 [Pseudomonadota bacterium]|jgi:NADH-quinone oxidoreductase subunit G
MEFELDGKKVEAATGSTILEVALKEGKYIPHFCYHKKLSIAANCRMCLVEVEKSPKPLPACATPITEGMKVHTLSKVAVEAQKGVMEFLLINHPLDCPICDQGGECQLQDLAVGYGKSASRFEEEKRAVSNKDIGPLISTEMTRCIHCSRCVRFTDEIAGYQELGMSYRNNHVEVMPFIGKTVNSELSGNIIDICPVGALTSKPFRNQYRSWELSRRKSISPHDGLGSNIIVQVDKYHQVVRILPNEKESLNECWLSDRDRFSYEGLYHAERATKPMIKQDGKWLEVEWDQALAYAAKGISGVIADHGTDAVGVLANSISTTEELFLLQKLMRQLGVNNLDSRLDQADFSLDDKTTGAFYLGADINQIAQAKSILVVGSMLRQEQPLLAQRLRQSVRNGSQLNVINVYKEDLLCKTQVQLTCDPRELVYFMAQVVKAALNITQATTSIDLSNVEVSTEAQQIAASLIENNGYIILGQVAKSSPDFAKLVALSQELATISKGNFGIMATRANEVGANIVGFVPFKGSFNSEVKHGLNARQMLEQPCKAYVLMNSEIEHDCYDANLALKAMAQAQTVIALTSYVSQTMLEYADVILPMSTFTETAGSYVNMQGLWQTFNGVTRPLGEAKPGWKILRVLANLLGDKRFNYTSIEDVRTEISMLKNTTSYLNNQVNAAPFAVTKPVLNSLVRIGINPIYASDSITRRATSLQQTSLAKQASLQLNTATVANLAASLATTVEIKQKDQSAKFEFNLTNNIAPTAIYLAANPATAKFAGLYDVIEINT